ncbi:MAG: hypothetical protein KJ607_03205 [Bacteroidetes bacterium]|nr:hypothetical protein [Bacteroidota bacterium]
MKTFIIKVELDGRMQSGQIGIKADDIEELGEKLKALKQIDNVIEHDDLLLLSELIHEKPQIVSFVNKLIEDYDKVGETRMIARAPKYISELKAILAK